MKKLSVIIVSYNVCYFLEQALVSVRRALNGLDAEVFVVDNNSADNSVAMVKQRFPEVTLLANKQNLGFAKANNLAIRKATGEYILLLNPDTVVEEDTFSKCLAFMDGHPEAGGLGVKMLDGNGNFLPESKRGLPTPLVAFYKIFGLAALFPQSRIFGQYYLSYTDKEAVQEVDVLAGAFMLLRHTSLNKTGYLDETFFMYGEDVDLSYRLQLAGYKNYYFPLARIIHYKGESTKRGSLNYVYLFYKAMSVFARKHFSSRQAAVLTFFIQVAILLRAGLSVISRFFRNILPFACDAALIYGGLYWLQDFWAQTYKREPGNFPTAFMQVAVPAYIATWLSTAFLTGAYDKPYRFGRLAGGLLLGTVLISALTNFLDQYRFSKAMILLGYVWALVAIWGRIVLLNFILRGNFKLQAVPAKRVAVVGGESEYQRVAELLQAAGVRAQLLGFLSPDPGDSEMPHYLGELHRLNEIAELRNLNELIFCGRDLTAGQIITWMVKLNNHRLQYKILPAGSEYIIGSHSKSSPGNYYALPIELNLLKKTYLRQKRLLDIVSSIIFILCSPFLIWQIQQKRNFLLNCIWVLRGHLSWVGLKYSLPPAKVINSVLTPADQYLNQPLSKEVEQQTEVLYAKEYALWLDIQIIRKNFSQLGRKVF